MPAAVHPCQETSAQDKEPARRPAAPSTTRPRVIAPHSTCSSLTSRSARCRRTAGRSTPPGPAGSTATSTPAFASAARRVLSSLVVSTSSRPGGATIRAAREIRICVSSTTRSGCRAGVRQAHVEARIVDAHGRHTGQQCGGPGAQLLHVGARGITGYPAALAACERRAAVEAGGHLEAQPGPAALHARQEAGIQFPGRGGAAGRSSLRCPPRRAARRRRR